MDILNKIIAAKEKEVERRKGLYPARLLEESIYFQTPVVSLGKYLRREDRLGVIAEFKRQSPSAGVINAHASVESVSIGYMQSGSSALSILTDTTFFGGKNTDLTEARKFNFCPILRKDFVIDEYQIIEARSIGADAILLIAACHSPENIKALADFAKSIGLEILLEIHDESELGHICDSIDVVGVNNRNLKDFSVSIDTSLRLLPLIPDNHVRISESGIKQAQDLATLKEAGFDGFLIGGHFMAQPDPALACANLIKESQRLLKTKRTAS